MRKALVMLSVLLLTLFALKQSSAILFSHQKYYFIQTGALSEEYFSLIKNYLQQTCSDKYACQSFIDSLKKEFPLIDKINIAYRPCGTYVMIYSHKPLCCINDNVILTNNSKTFLKDSFAENAILDIPHIMVAPDYVSQVSSIVPPLLQKLSPDFHERYHLEFNHNHYVRLLDKQENNFSIVSLSNQKNVPKLLAYSECVKKNISARKGFDKGTHWIADIRFNDYIVVYKDS